MGWLKVLFGFLDGLMSYINREKDRESGRNEEKLTALEEVEKRWSKANEINNEPIVDDDISYLLRPEDRTADNLRLLQNSKTNVSDVRGDNGVQGKRATQKSSGDDIQAQPSIRKDLPVKYKFSKQSKAKLATCHKDLQIIMEDVIKIIDITVLCGHRGEKEQNEAFAKGTSKLKWPESKHNKNPSHAVDIAPYPLDWQNILAFKELGAIVKSVASSKGISIKWGGDFKGSFKDYPHYQLENVN